MCTPPPPEPCISHPSSSLQPDLGSEPLDPAGRHRMHVVGTDARASSRWEQDAKAPQFQGITAASQACAFAGFLISFTAFTTLYSLLSSPQPLQPGNVEEEPPGSCPALAPRDVGTNSLLAPQGRAWAQGCVPAFISETNSFSFSLHCWGRSGGLRGLAPAQHRSSSRIARWSHPAHPLVALQTFLRDQSLRFFSPGAGQERGRAATRRAALTRT